MSTTPQQQDKDSGWDELTANRLQKRCRQSHRTRYWKVHDKNRYTCPKCGRRREEIHQWHVHHIDHDPLNGKMNNLVALCRDCHIKIHGGEPPRSLSQWKSDFLEMGTAES